MSTATRLGGNNPMASINAATYFYFSYYYFFTPKK